MPASLIARLLGWIGLPQWALELAVIGAAASAVWLWHHSTLERGIAAGVAKRDAYYRPLLEAAQNAKAAADARNHELEASQATVTKELEEHHAQDVRDLTTRAADAERRIADILRQRATNPPACGQPVPTIPRPTDPGSAASNGYDAAVTGGPGSRLGRDAAECQHDADELAVWIAWYKRQKALTLAK